MQNLADARRVRCLLCGTSDDFTRAFCREIADADKPFGLQNTKNFAQMLVAGGKERSPLLRRQFVGGTIAAVFLDKRERAIIHHDVFFKKRFGRAKTFGEQSPQTLAADFSARAIESHYRPLGMFVRRTLDCGWNREPIADCRDFAEWDTSLG